MALLKEQALLCREIGNTNGLLVSLGNQVNILYSLGDRDGALTLHREQEHLCRELGNPEGLSISLANQAALVSSTPGRRREARRLADEALDIATQYGYGPLVPQIQRVRDSIPPDEE